MPQDCSHLKRCWRRLLVEADGATAVEFAIVVLPMVIIFVVIVQFGLILYVQNDMQNAAREAARRMAVDDTTIFTPGDSVDCSSGPASGTVAEVACRVMNDWPGVFTVTTDTAVIVGSDRSEMTVSISTDMGSVGIFDIFGVASGKNLSASTTLRSEYQFP